MSISQDPLFLFVPARTLWWLTSIFIFDTDFFSPQYGILKFSLISQTPVAIKLNRRSLSQRPRAHTQSHLDSEYDFYRRYGKRAFASCSQMLLHGQSYGREVKRGSKVFIQQNQKQFGIHSHANTNAPSLGGTNYFPFHLMLRLVILYPLITHMNSCIQSCSKQRHVSKAL